MSTTGISNMLTALRSDDKPDLWLYPDGWDLLLTWLKIRDEVASWNNEYTEPYYFDLEAFRVMMIDAVTFWSSSNTRFRIQVEIVVFSSQWSSHILRAKQYLAEYRPLTKDNFIDIQDHMAYAFWCMCHSVGKYTDDYVLSVMASAVSLYQELIDRDPEGDEYDVDQGAAIQSTISDILPIIINVMILTLVMKLMKGAMG